MRQNTKASPLMPARAFRSCGADTQQPVYSRALSDMRQGGQSDSAKDFEVFQEGGPSRIQFTGGSTGAPKGAARTHAADLVEIPRYLRDHRA